MKRILSAAIPLLVLTSTVLFSQQPSPKVSGSSQRFQLIAAQVQEQSGHKDLTFVTAPAVFILDTKTGRIWRHSPSVTLEDTNGKTETKQPEIFYPVRFTIPDPKNPGYSWTPPE